MGVCRADVENFLKAKKIRFCVDATNKKTIYERNKVRLSLLPLLAREYNPQIINALSDLANTAGEDYEFLSAQAGKQFEKSVKVVGRKVKLDLKSIAGQHPAIIRLVLRQMAENLTKDPSALNFEHIHALEDLAALGRHGVVDLAHHLRAVKTLKYLVGIEIGIGLAFSFVRTSP